MGAPTDRLVAIATMYDNPQGLTKEEILFKYNNIKLRSLRTGEKVKSGLYGFSELFNLNFSHQYLKNREKYWNKDYKYSSKNFRKGFFNIPILSNSLVIEKSYQSIGKTKMQCETTDYSEFGVNLFEGYKIGDHVEKSHSVKICIPDKYKNPKNSFIIRKVLNREIAKYDVFEDFHNGVEINEDLEVEVVQFSSKEFEFDSFEKLWVAYPEYHPEKIYDFNQKKGFLYPYKEYGEGSNSSSFKWIKKGDKYFLDIDNFSRIINANSFFGLETNDPFEVKSWKHFQQGNKSKYSLTDIVLTSEAIRRRAWRKLGYNALFFDNRNFIYKNQRTLRRYEKAVLETELIVEAKTKGWTNSQFLREYHSQITNRTKTPFEEIKRMLKEENKQRGIERRKYTIKKRKREKEEARLKSLKPEIPF